jgi:hypothetical protein
MIGIGEIDTRTYGLNGGMANAGIGLYVKNFLNNSNPATLIVDSLAFIFDVSLGSSFSQFSSAGITENAKNANIKKVAFGVKLFPRFTLSGGITPFSNVQYKIHTTADVEGGNSEKYDLYYDGSGGLTKAYLSGSYKLLPNLRVGASASYLFGRINRTESLVSHSVSTASEVDEILMDFGLIYNKAISNATNISAGLTYSYESQIKMKNYTTYSMSGETDVKSSTYTSLPHSIGAGAALQTVRGRSYGVFSIDYRFGNWASIKSPDQRMHYANNHRINAGLAYVPNYRTPRNYFQRIQYQAGGYGEISNLIINGNRLMETGFTVGAVFPIKNNYSQIYFSADFGSRGGKGLINENYIRLNVGVSINQTWFLKWQYD